MIASALLRINLRFGPQVQKFKQLPRSTKGRESRRIAVKKLWPQQIALGLVLLGGTSAWAQYPPNNVGPSSFPIANQATGQAAWNPTAPPAQYQPAQQAQRYAQPGQPYQQQQGQPYQQQPYQPQPYQPQPYQQQVQPYQQAQNNSPSGMQLNLPQVPSNYQPTFQFVGSQEQLGNGYSDALPQPSVSNLAAPPYPSPQSYQPSMQAAVAQPASTLGNYGYAVGSTMAAAPECNNCGPNVYSTPSIFDGESHGWRRHGSHLANLCGLPEGAKPWFFGGGYMIMNRIDDQDVKLLWRDSDLEDVLSTGDAQMNAASGFQVMAGRYFNCGRNAIQASYWGIFPDKREVFVHGPGGQFTPAMFNPGDVMSPVDPLGNFVPTDVYTWFGDAAIHRVCRTSQFHNLEVNLLGFGVGGAARSFNRCTEGSLFSGHAGCRQCGDAGCSACSSRYATGPCGYVGPQCGSRLNLSWLAGFRYFRFEDQLCYAASLNNDALDGGLDDMYYNIETTNDLVGFQIGGRGDYCVTKKINLYGLGKVGVYNNFANLNTVVGNSISTAYDANFPATSYLVDEDHDQVAFISELGAGVGVRVTQKWTATVGYQALIASGVATGVGNLRRPGGLVRDQLLVNSNDALILHGLTVGALYNF